MGQKANAPLLFSSTGTTNFRDLGGYKTKDGRVTHAGVVYRSDALSGLSDEDIRQIRALGITDVIDLRDERELATLPNDLANAEGFHYHHMPLFVDITQDGMVQEDATMGDLYVNILDSLSARVAAVLRTILNAKGGAVFHCFAGKDRTGVTAMLLLTLAGVPDETVVNDYSVSYENIRHRFDGMEGVREKFLRSDAENMHMLLAHLWEKYQNTENYLLHAGLTQEEIDSLKAKLLG